MKREDKITKFGFFNIDKPSGITSSAVVNKLKWLTGVPCGHMGTLDPLASGVLPVGAGNATRLFDYFLEKRKEYIAEFTFGVTSDTLDSTGELIYGGNVPSEAEIAGVLPNFCGELDQIPPKYSAKNVNGRRGYELAREGADFQLPPKKVSVYSIELLGKAEEKENTYRLKINCGGGTYIRSLARDIAEALGTKAVMSGLRRTQSGCFEIAHSVKFEELTEENFISYLIPTQEVLLLPDLDFSGASKIFNGVASEVSASDRTYKIFRDGDFYGLAEVKDGKARIIKKLC